MNNRFFRVALILSVAANVSFVAGALFVKQRVDTLASFDGRLEITLRRLDSTDEQRAMIRAAADAYLRKEEAVRAEYRPRSTEFLRELDRETPDRARLERDLIEFARFEHELGPDRRAFVLEMLLALTPAQREKLFELRRRSNVTLFAGLPD